MVEKKIKTVLIHFEAFSEWDFIAPGTFYIRMASGDYLFMKTSDRKSAQEYINKEFGKGKYTVVAAKIQKTVSRLESGGLSCTGTATRKGQKR